MNLPEIFFRISSSYYEATRIPCLQEILIDLLRLLHQPEIPFIFTHGDIQVEEAFIRCDGSSLTNF